jgi:hypothetical protein
MSIARAAVAGLIGAGTLTLIHQTAKRVTAEAPRMDLLGERAIVLSSVGLGIRPPSGEVLHQAALAGDIVSNTLYYSLAAVAGPRNAPALGTLLGLAAGVGAVALPGPLGLGTAPSGRTDATKAMAVAWYTFGGLAAGLAYRALAGKRWDQTPA